MTEHILKFDSRHIKREFQKALRGSIPKILTELVTNADDSYRRVMQDRSSDPSLPVESPAPITIEFNRRKNLFAVVDHAEGLTDKQMEKSFTTYGKDSRDHLSGHNTRSLFGKGLRDVLFTQYHGRVKSIRDGVFYVCEFRWKDKAGHESPVIDIKTPRPADASLRAALGIPRNGTRVEFELAGDVRKPQTPKLVETLCQFYMLRNINANTDRLVSLRVLSAGSKAVSHQLTYSPPDLDVKCHVDTIYRPDAKHSIAISGDIGLTDIELPQGEVGYTDRVGGILVVDEDDAVLDLSLFGYDDDPDARRISGRLHFDGVGAYIREKLNQSSPEEILTDTRDGFDKNHAFYRGLRDILKPYITPIVETLREQAKGVRLNLSAETQKRHKDAFDLLNKLANDLLGDVGTEPRIPDHLKMPPPTGIAFLRQDIVIRAGVVTPLPMLINTEMIAENEVINITSKNPHISCVPMQYSLDTAARAENPFIKVLRISSDQFDISGTIVAQCGEYNASVNVHTVAREIVTPIDGLQFEREKYKVRIGGTRALTLYVDTKKIPVGSQIDFTISNEGIGVRPVALIVQEAALVTQEIAACKITVAAKIEIMEANVRAVTGTYIADAHIAVTDKQEEKEHGAHGLFKGCEYAAHENLKAQSIFNEDTGMIIINLADPVNERYFSDNSDGATKAVEEKAYCQVRLADLILNECLQHMVARAYAQGTLERKYPDDPAQDIRRYADEKRFDIGLRFHNLIVNKA